MAHIQDGARCLRREKAKGVGTSAALTSTSDDLFGGFGPLGGDLKTDKLIIQEEQAAADETEQRRLLAHGIDWFMRLAWPVAILADLLVLFLWPFLMHAGSFATYELSDFDGRL